MKFLKTFAVVGMLAMLALCTIPETHAQANGTLTGLPASATATSNNFVSSAITLHPVQGLALIIPFSQSASGTNNGMAPTYFFSVSCDGGTTYSTTNDFPILMQPNTTNVVYWATNFTSAQLANYDHFRLRGIGLGNGTNTHYCSNILWQVTDPPGK